MVHAILIDCERPMCKQSGYETETIERYDFFPNCKHTMHTHTHTAWTRACSTIWYILRHSNSFKWSLFLAHVTYTLTGDKSQYFSCFLVKKANCLWKGTPQPLYYLLDWWWPNLDGPAKVNWMFCCTRRSQTRPRLLMYCTLLTVPRTDWQCSITPSISSCSDVTTPYRKCQSITGGMMGRWGSILTATPRTLLQHNHLQWF